MKARVERMRRLMRDHLGCEAAGAQASGPARKSNEVLSCPQTRLPRLTTDARYQHGQKGLADPNHQARITRTHWPAFTRCHTLI
jgi:hypothetical protein